MFRRKMRPVIKLPLSKSRALLFLFQVMCIVCLKYYKMIKQIVCIPQYFVVKCQCDFSKHKKTELRCAFVKFVLFEQSLLILPKTNI